METSFEFFGFRADPRIVIYANLGLAQCVENCWLRGPRADAYLIFTAEQEYHAKVSLDLLGERIDISAQGRDPYLTLNILFSRLEAALRPQLSDGVFLEESVSQLSKKLPIHQNARGSSHSRKHHHRI